MSPLGLIFLEVLVSFALISLGSLSLITFTSQTLANTQHNNYLIFAQQQLSNIAQRLAMISNSTAIYAQINAWNQENNLVLPQGNGKVTGMYPNYRVTLCWFEAHAAQVKFTTTQHKSCLFNHINLIPRAQS